MDGSKPIVLVESTGLIDEQHFAPDVKWVVYNSDESGTGTRCPGACRSTDRRALAGFNRRRSVPPLAGRQPGVVFSGA